MINILALLAFLGLTASAWAQNTAQPSVPTDAQILEAQGVYYGLFLQRLSHDLADARAALPVAVAAAKAERDKAWGEYSKSLWKSEEQHSEAVPAQSVPTIPAKP